MGISDLFADIAAELAKMAILDSDEPLVIDDRPKEHPRRTCPCDYM
jgi:hypothetical protein